MSEPRAERDPLEILARRVAAGDRQERSERLQKAIDNLAPQYRQVIVLACIEQDPRGGPGGGREGWTPACGP
ncbi:MAG: hypothetical protein JXA90_01085 [Planctomycetes bacterium]|nr:hypothetical protein [Planctomycetota bacterium]